MSGRPGAVAQGVAGGGGVTRLTVSVPGEVARDLDRLVDGRGYGSRSQAVSRLISDAALEFGRERGRGIMTGTITLFYSVKRSRLLVEIARLKRRYIDEVIGSLEVQLEDDHVMDVIIVQGPEKTLAKITDALVACRGVRVGRLALTSSLIPPVHPIVKKS